MSGRPPPPPPPGTLPPPPPGSQPFGGSVPPPPTGPSRSPRAWIIGGIAAVLVAGIVVALVLFLPDGEAPEQETAPAGSPFVGSWEATDELDNSQMELEISPAGEDRFRIELWDDRVSFVCKGEAVHLTGEGQSAGSTLASSLEGPCSESGAIFTADQTFTYHPESDTLTDDLNPGTEWSRS